LLFNHQRSEDKSCNAQSVAKTRHYLVHFVFRIGFEFYVWGSFEVPNRKDMFLIAVKNVIIFVNLAKLKSQNELHIITDLSNMPHISAD